MRVAFQTIQQGLLDSLGRIGKSLARTTAHLSSGSRINQASEDPVGAAAVGKAREELARIDSRRSAIVTGRGFLSATDGALDAVGGELASARSLAIQGLSDPNAGVRGLIATQVDGLRDQLLHEGRTLFQGRYVFGGTQTLADPFDAAGNYLGDSGAIQAQVDDQQSVQLNLPGNAVFKSPSDLPKLLADLSAALRAGDTAAMTTAEAALKSATDQIANARATVGYRMQALDAADVRLAGRSLAVQQTLSGIQDADIPKEVTDAARLQTASQATLSVLSREGNRSLFDYLA